MNDSSLNNEPFYSFVLIRMVLLYSTPPLLLLLRAPHLPLNECLIATVIFVGRPKLGLDAPSLLVLKLELVYPHAVSLQALIAQLVVILKHLVVAHTADTLRQIRYVPQ